MIRRARREVAALRNVFDEQHSAEQIERYHLIKAAQLVLRNEATRQGRLMVDFLEELGLLTTRDYELLEEVERFQYCESQENRRRVRLSPYYRELRRTYRPQQYESAVATTVRSLARRPKRPEVA